MSAALNSFELDELCRAHSRNSAAMPVAVDYAPVDDAPVDDAPVDDAPVDDALEAVFASHRRMVRAVAAFCLSIGFLAGMAAVATPLILGAA